MRPRRSVAGPLILITLGVLFLFQNAWPAFSAFRFFGDYWPYLLIFWGVLQIAEVTFQFWRGNTLPVNGVSGGAWVLVLLIVAFGVVTFQARGPWRIWRHVGFGQGVGFFGEPHDFPIAEQSQPAGKAPEIVIENFRGNVRITGADVNQVAMTGHKIVRSFKDEDAEKANRQTSVTLSVDGNRVRLRGSGEQNDSDASVSTDIELTVPEGATLNATGLVGDFDVNNLSGDVRIRSDNAGVRLQDIGGNVLISTAKGDVVRCFRVKGTVDLRGHNSDVELEQVGGAVTIDGSYSGVIALRNLAGPVRATNMRTSLSVLKVPGQITIERGSVVARGLRGPVDLSTHTSDVDLSNFDDAVTVRVDKGDVSLRPAIGPLAAINVRTNSGDIDFAIPEKAHFQLSAATDRGEIENDFGAPLNVENHGHRAKLDGSVGAGPKLVLTTDRGSISIRRLDSSEIDTLSEVPAPPPPPDPPAAAPRLRHNRSRDALSGNLPQLRL